MDLTGSEYGALVKIASFIKTGMVFIQYGNKRMVLIRDTLLQPVHVSALFQITA
jgi:hypothetical protein